ncbi:MAG: hypothetical protein A2516_01750 [Alphaproteobacteria bacterium RIFOXYD12_FULL_60_8]|nr:MAG: hypothetical protein A2516_01750 [Alphaproteobacteria bacterium RIFOXYD12_FULL_60_8]
MTVAQDSWVFAYGSLMWRPDFVFEERVGARLFGYHRQACIYSTHYRGTLERPGLVVGLMRGGSCAGCCYRVAVSRWEEVKAYLDGRELITQVYIPKMLRCRLVGGRLVTAYAFVADPHHPQYAGGLTLDEQVKVVRQGRGKEGSSREYLANLSTHLGALGVHDRALHRLLEIVDEQSTF